MSRRRDTAAFDRRADTYDQGWLGRWHIEITEAARALARSTTPNATSILDVGCGTGQLLRKLAIDFESATELIGVDASPAMIQSAKQARGDTRIRFEVAAAESLPAPDHAFDLVMTTTSFDHWRAQSAGLDECRRVLRPHGRLILVDLISPVLWPTTILGRRGKARTPRQINQLLLRVGFQSIKLQKISTLIRAVTASSI